MNQSTSSETTPKPIKIRRTREQWQTIVERFEQSGLRVQAFCEQHNIAYSSFAKWRSVFTQEKQNPSSALVSFIPLSESALLSNNIPWRIELDLGNGVILRLIQ